MREKNSLNNQSVCRCFFRDREKAKTINHIHLLILKYILVTLSTRRNFICPVFSYTSTFFVLKILWVLLMFFFSLLFSRLTSENIILSAYIFSLFFHFILKHQTEFRYTLPQFIFVMKFLGSTNGKNVTIDENVFRIFLSINSNQTIILNCVVIKEK